MWCWVEGQEDAHLPRSCARTRQPSAVHSTPPETWLRTTRPWNIGAHSSHFWLLFPSASCTSLRCAGSLLPAVLVIPDWFPIRTAAWLPPKLCLSMIGSFYTNINPHGNTLETWYSSRRVSTTSFTLWCSDCSQLAHYSLCVFGGTWEINIPFKCGGGTGDHGRISD